MRKLLIILLIALPCSAQHHRKIFTSGGSPTVVTYCTGETYAASPQSFNCAFGSARASGDIEIVDIYADSGIAIGAPTGCVLSWTVLGTPGSGQAAYIGTSSGSGICNIAISGSGATGQVTAAAYDLSGVIATIDGTPTYSHPAYCTNCTGPSTTTTTNGDMVLTFISQISLYTVTPTGTPLFVVDFTNASVTDTGSHFVQSTYGAIDMTWSWSGAAPYCFIVAVKP